jgi:hypothetical protein
MKSRGICLFVLAVGLFGQIPPLHAGPCTEDIAVLDELLRPPPPSKSKRPRSGQPSAPLPEARYDPLLAQAKKLDAENNPDCRRLIDEILLIIGM